MSTVSTPLGRAQVVVTPLPKRPSGLSWPCSGLLTNVPFTPKVCPGVGADNQCDESSKSGKHGHRGQIAGPAGTERPNFMGVPARVCCFVTPAGLAHDLAFATLQTPTAAATPAENATTHQSDFELPEWVVNDVLEAGTKKKRKVA